MYTLTCPAASVKFIGIKESVYIRKELNSNRTGLVSQHGRRVIVLKHQCRCHDVICTRSASAQKPYEGRTIISVTNGSLVKFFRTPSFMPFIYLITGFKPVEEIVQPI